MHEKVLWQRQDNRICPGIKDPGIVIEEDTVERDKQTVEVHEYHCQSY
jgi:hypothetical protein